MQSHKNECKGDNPVFPIITQDGKRSDFKVHKRKKKNIDAFGIFRGIEQNNPKKRAELNVLYVHFHIYNLKVCCRINYQ